MKKVKLLFLMMICAFWLGGASNAFAGTKTVYLVPGGMDAADAEEHYGLWVWGDGVVSKWYMMSDSNRDGIYECTLPDGVTGLKIARRGSDPASATTYDNGNIWNEGNDINTVSDGIVYTFTGYSDGKITETHATTFYGTYYLYNVGAEKYLCSGNLYGSQASVDEGGIPVSLLKVSDGVYNISTASIYSGRYLSTGGYMDSDIANWTFTSAGDDEYKITDGTNYLYWNSGTTVVLNSASAPDTDASKWKLVTEAERITNLTGATKASPKDATFLIKNYYFAKGNDMIVCKENNQLDSSPSWKGDQFTNVWGANSDDGYSGLYYFAAEQWNKNFDNYQTMTAPKGKYKLSCYGYYRGGGETDYSTTKNAYLYANTHSKAIKSRMDDALDTRDDSKGMKYGVNSNTKYVPGDLINASIAFNAGLYKNELDFYIDNNNANNLTLGVKKETLVSGDWTVFDNFELLYYGSTIGAVSDNLPNTAVTAGEWYKFTTGNSSDAYTLSSSGAATITYTTDGTLEYDAEVGTTWALTAKQNVTLAPNTTYYVKSSAAVTLTKSETSVTSSYVSGWTKVTSISDLQDSPEDYFFAIYSANNTGLMLGASGKYTDAKLYYKTAANPLSSSAYLFEMENYDGALVLKSSAIGKYFKNASGNPWNYEATETETGANCKNTVTLSDGVYTLQTANTDAGAGNYIGLWTPGNGYTANEYLAGNKSANNKGSFLIYRIAKNGLNMTSLITNPDFSAATWDNGWTGTGNNKKEAFASNSGNANFTGNFAEMWVANSSSIEAANLNQTINELPVGVYTLSAKIQSSIDSKFYASISDVDQYLDCNGAVANKSFRFIVTDASDVKIGLKHDGVTSASGDVWVAVDDFGLVYEGVLSTSAQKADLNTAITDANAAGHTLGFDDGEYAPYTNAAMLQALETGSAIYASTTATTAEVEAATTAITSASWTANDGEMDAVYNGNMDIANGNNPKGWTREDNAWGRQATSKEEGFDFSITSNKTAWYYNISQKSSYYGNDGVYTMPLKGSTTYQLKVKYCAQGGSPATVYATVRTGETKVLDGYSMGAVSNGNKTIGKEAVNAFEEKSTTFTTGSAGDYILELKNQGNFYFTDVSIKKATPVVIDENMEEDEYSPVAGTVNVTLNRTIKADKWNTFCVPFAINNDELKAAFGDGVKIAQYTSEANEDGVHTDITFTKMADGEDAVSANTPVLLKTSRAGTSYTFPGRTIATGTTTTVSGTHGFDFVGSYKKKFFIPTGDYYISDNAVYRSSADNGTYIRNTRAYIKAKSAGARMGSFFIDEEETTAIEGLTIEPAIVKTTGKIYNLQGQEVKNIRKGGIYIQNGRKMVK